jgi:hypothetical protein
VTKVIKVMNLTIFKEWTDCTTENIPNGSILIMGKLGCHCNVGVHSTLKEHGITPLLPAKGSLLLSYIG